MKRNLEFTDSTFADENILEFSLASEEPYLRTDEKDNPYNEVLVISEEAISFDRLVDQKAPFLFEHDTEKQIGVIEKAFIADKKLKVIVRFSENSFAQEILRDIKAGIRRNVSLGYIIENYQMSPGNPIDTMFVTRWTPYEGSSVSVPADHTVGFQRNLQIEGEKTMIDETKIEEIKTEETPQSEEIQAVEEVKAVEEETVENEIIEETVEDQTEESKPVEEEIIEETEDETEEIRAIGELTGEEELAEQCITEKKSLVDFKNLIKQKKSQNKIDKKPIGAKMKKFSISKAIRNACSQYRADVSEELEAKVVAENKRSLGIGEEYDVVVTKQQLRALSPAEGKGAEIIQGDYLPQEFTPALRPELTLEATGYHVIPVTGPSVSFAVVTSGAQAQMYDLDGTLADADLTFATKELRPRKEGVCVPIPYSLLLQARPEIDAIVEQDIVNALAELRDKMILVGTGTNNQPTRNYCYCRRKYYANRRYQNLGWCLRC